MLTFVWLGHPTALCTVYPVMSVPSPSGQFRAEVKNEICESKNRYDTIVWLTDGVSVNLGGKTWSALIAPSTQNVAGGSYSPLQLQLTWLNDSELEISFPAGTELRSRAEARNGVEVNYRERSAP
jgi:hypothetical protein